MKRLVERCDRQIKGDCLGCRFDGLVDESNFIYSSKNSVCSFYEKVTYEL